MTRLRPFIRVAFCKCVTVASRSALILTACLYVASGQAPNAPTATTRLTAEAAVSEAIVHNLDYIAQRFDLPVAEAQIITARLRPNPVVTLGGDHLDWLGTNFNLQTNNGGPEEYSARGDFLFERGRKRQARTALATQVRDVTRLSLVDAVRALVQNVQNAYVDVVTAQNNLGLAKENLKLFDELVRLNGIRYKDGDIARVELIRAEVAQLQFANVARTVEIQVQSSSERLRLLLGRTRFQPFEVAPELRRDNPVSNQNELLTRALAQRPDLQALVRDEQRASADLRLQRANAKVDIQLGSEYRRQQVTASANALGLFMQAQLPVFNRNQGEIARAQQGVLQAQARSKALRVTVENDVNLALLDYEAARSALDRIEKSMLGKARDVRSISEYAYRRGEVSLVEFLDAVRAYNDTIQSYNDARADYARSLNALDAATGGTTATGTVGQP